MVRAFAQSLRLNHFIKNFYEVQKMKKQNNHNQNNHNNHNQKNGVKIDIYNIIKNGGVTLNHAGDAVTFSKGYQVSKKDLYIIDVKKIDKIVKAIKTALRSCDKGECVGVWIDNGFAYIDKSECIKGLKRALQVARGRRQLSIFEWSTGECIACKG
jgi:hypothetical protein